MSLHRVRVNIYECKRYCRDYERRVRIQILEVDDNESSLCDDTLLCGILPS